MAEWVHSDDVEMRKLSATIAENHKIVFISLCQSIQWNDSKYSKGCIHKDIHGNIINNSEKLKSRYQEKVDGYYVTTQWNGAII